MMHIDVAFADANRATNFYKTLLYYQKQGYDIEDIDKRGKIVSFNIDADPDFIARMVHYLVQYAAHVEFDLSADISHITKEQLKQGAKKSAEAVKKGAVKAGKFAAEHPEAVKTAAEVGAVLLL